MFNCGLSIFNERILLLLLLVIPRLKYVMHFLHAGHRLYAASDPKASQNQILY